MKKLILSAAILFGMVQFIQAQSDVQDCAPCEGKVTSLELGYTGAEEAIVTVTDRRGTIVLFEGTVAPNSSFTVVGTRESTPGKAKTPTLGAEISVFINDSLESDIHTSCSLPIGPGMEFGELVVISGESLDGGLLCDATGQVQEDDEEDEEDDEEEDEEEEDDDEDGEDSCECRGGATELVFQYVGAEAEVGVVQRKLGELLYQAVTPTDGIVAVTGTWREGKLGNEILLFVNGDMHEVIHTSCSEPLVVGTAYGDFLLVAGASRRGGDFCDSVFPEPPPPVVVEPPSEEPPVEEPAPPAEEAG